VVEGGGIGNKSCLIPGGQYVKRLGWAAILKKRAFAGKKAPAICIREDQELIGLVEVNDMRRVVAPEWRMFEGSSCLPQTGRSDYVWDWR